MAILGKGFHLQGVAPLWAVSRAGPAPCGFVAGPPQFGFKSPHLTCTPHPDNLFQFGTGKRGKGTPATAVSPVDRTPNGFAQEQSTMEEMVFTSESVTE